MHTFVIDLNISKTDLLLTDAEIARVLAALVKDAVKSGKLPSSTKVTVQTVDPEMAS